MTTQAPTHRETRTSGTASQLAQELTTRSAILSESPDSTYGCTPTLYYHPNDPDGLVWSARIRVKPPRRRDREAWANGRTPEGAMAGLLAAVDRMVSGDTPAHGGQVTR